MSYAPAMVSAIYALRKHTTRRVLPTPEDGSDPVAPISVGDTIWVRETHYRFGWWEVDYSKRMEDDRLRWKFVSANDECTFDRPRLPGGRKPRQGPPADDDEKGRPQWYRRPAMFFFRRWCRLELTVTRVSVERLHEISLQAAMDEGVASLSKDGKRLKFGIPDRDGLPGTDDEGWPWPDWQPSSVEAFRRLWETIHGRGAWDRNPFVAAYEFRIIQHKESR